MNTRRYLVLATVITGLVSFGAAGDEKPPKLTKDEQAIVDLTNKARADKKLPPLKVNPLLMKAAATHSANMARQGKMEHKLDGKEVPARLDDIGYKREECRENIGLLDKVTTVFQAWMQSKVHRDNILDEKVEEIGVGLAHDPRNPRFWYMTQVFGKSTKEK